MTTRRKRFDPVLSAVVDWLLVAAGATTVVEARAAIDAALVLLERKVLGNE